MSIPKFSNPTNNSRMKNLRYLSPEDCMSICSAVRDIYGEIENQEHKKKLRYVENIAKEMVARLEELDPGWLRKMYPKRKDFDKIMENL